MGQKYIWAWEFAAAYGLSCETRFDKLNSSAGHKMHRDFINTKGGVMRLELAWQGQMLGHSIQQFMPDYFIFGHKQIKI